MEQNPEGVQYCVEVVTTFNRNLPSERVVMTGQYDVYQTMAEARVQARQRGVDVFALAAGETLDGGEE